MAQGTFYNHIFRRADRTKYQDEQAQPMLKVQQVFYDSQQRYGAEKIRVVLAENGTHVSAKRVAAIMQELNLKSIRVDAKKQYKKQQRIRKKNLLQRDFTAEHPNQTWVSDFTYFRINQYWVYLCVIIDLYSRKVVGYRVSRNASTHLVTATFKSAFQMRGKPKNLTFHSDRGSQYTSATFTQLLQTNGVKQSFSASGRPIDNASQNRSSPPSKRRGVPQRVHLRRTLSEKRRTLYSVLQRGSPSPNAEIQDAASL